MKSNIHFKIIILLFKIMQVAYQSNNLIFINFYSHYLIKKLIIFLLNSVEPQMIAKELATPVQLADTSNWVITN